MTEPDYRARATVDLDEALLRLGDDPGADGVIPRALVALAGAVVSLGRTTEAAVDELRRIAATLEQRVDVNDLASSAAARDADADAALERLKQRLSGSPRCACGDHPVPDGTDLVVVSGEVHRLAGPCYVDDAAAAPAQREPGE